MRQSHRGNSFRIVFPRGVDDVERAKMQNRGGIEVRIEGDDGSRYNATFITPERAGTNMANARARGFPCLADINLIIVPEVTVEAIHAAVEFLWGEGFFRRYAMPSRPTPKRILAMLSDYLFLLWDRD